MKKDIIILLLSISTVVGFTLAYSQYSRLDILEQEVQVQREIAEQNMLMALRAQEHAERLQELTKNTLDRARIAEDSAMAAQQRARKTDLK